MSVVGFVWGRVGSLEVVINQGFFWWSIILGHRFTSAVNRLNQFPLSINWIDLCYVHRVEGKYVQLICWPDKHHGNNSIIFSLNIFHHIILKAGWYGQSNVRGKIGRLIESLRTNVFRFVVSINIYIMQRNNVIIRRNNVYRIINTD